MKVSPASSNSELASTGPSTALQNLERVLSEDRRSPTGRNATASSAGRTSPQRTSAASNSLNSAQSRGAASRADQSGANVRVAEPSVRLAGNAFPLRPGRGATSAPEVQKAAEVRVPRPSFQGSQGPYDATVASGDGRRWITPHNLAHYLNNTGYTGLTAADLTAANPGRAQTLHGNAVFPVGSTVNVVPGAAAIAQAAGASPQGGFSAESGVSAAVGRRTGPVSVFSLTPVDPTTGQPDIANTKIFVTTPGTPAVVTTFRPSDNSVAVGVGGSVTVGQMRLFGNVRVEFGPGDNSHTTSTGLSLNAGWLLPVPGSPGVVAGPAAQGRVSADIDWVDVIRSVGWAMLD
jgi:hypothetical protein